MGFFSWECAVSGLPIMAIAHETAPKLLSSVIAIKPDDSLGIGLYDGYGRLYEPGGKVYELPLDDNFLPVDRLVLQAFYDIKNPPGYRDLKQNVNDAGQGWFHDGHVLAVKLGKALRTAGKARVPR